jgi:hypothetical protein
LHDPFDAGRFVAVVQGCRIHLRRRLAEASASANRGRTMTGQTSLSQHEQQLQPDQDASMKSQPTELEDDQPYSLVVVDEAHHLYSRAETRALVESFMTEGTTQRLLLSDLSQSLGRDIQYPGGLRDVVLHEVVRCSKRIVAGAMAFQLGGEEKLLTKCHHDSTGPPLKSFLFDVLAAAATPAAPQAASWEATVARTSSSSTFRSSSVYYRSYAEHVVQALQHVVSVFANFSLHNRLALVVPSMNFSEGLRPELEILLREHFPRRRFRLVDAATASAYVGRLPSDRAAAAAAAAACNNEAI